jgi:hypothetical protein
MLFVIICIDYDQPPAPILSMSDTTEPYIPMPLNKTEKGIKLHITILSIHPSSFPIKRKVNQAGSANVEIKKVALVTKLTSHEKYGIVVEIKYEYVTTNTEVTSHLMAPWSAELRMFDFPPPPLDSSVSKL